MFVHLFFFFKQKTAYEIMPSLVGSEMCIRDRLRTTRALLGSICLRLSIAFSALYSCQNEKAAFMNMTRKHAIPSGTLFEMIAITPAAQRRIARRWVNWERIFRQRGTARFSSRTFGPSCLS